MKIAVVILNWNGQKLLEQFLPSVILHSENAQIYVIDNNSTDDSVPFVKTNFQSVKVIQNSENGGYAKGYNEGLKQIEADIYCLLNSDVEVTENWLLPVANTFKNEPETSIIQPKILDYNNKERFEYAGAAGGFIDKYAYPFCRGRIFNSIEKDSGQYNDSTEIFWASGACFFIRRNVFDLLNGFDESFFAHMEEIDLCWRAFNFKFVTKYVGSSAVYHIGGATLHNSNPKKTYLNFRNSLFTLTKNASGNLALLILSRLILDGIAGIKFILEFKLDHVFAIIKAHFSFYAHLGQLLKQRKSLNQEQNYSKLTSIVWSYFIKKKTHYNSL